MPVRPSVALIAASRSFDCSSSRVRSRTRLSSSRSRACNSLSSTAKPMPTMHSVRMNSCARTTSRCAATSPKGLRPVLIIIAVASEISATNSVVRRVPKRKAITATAGSNSVGVTETPSISPPWADSTAVASNSVSTSAMSSQRVRRTRWCWRWVKASSSGV
jgi:hypothetical protein